MREIKFRAWQKHHRKMLPVKIIDFNRNTITVDYGEKTIPRFNTFDMENFELMQYTGLKDKNGVEIYEGDIVTTDIKRPYLIVVFRDGCFMFNCNDGGEDYYDIMVPITKEPHDAYRYGEVIDNIHNNPELL